MIRDSFRSARRPAAILALVALLLAAGCDDDPSQPSPQPPASSPIRFDQLAVGQESRYAFFHCTQYGAPGPGTQIYASDTLLVAVVSETAGRFRVTETLTPGSISRQDSTNIPDPDSVYSYSLEPTPDSL